jgi:hypothetical protein
MAKDWIAGAVKHKGALHRQLGISADKPIPTGRLHSAIKKGGLLGKRAQLALTLRNLKH